MAALVAGDPDRSRESEPLVIAYAERVAEMATLLKEPEGGHTLARPGSGESESSPSLPLGTQINGRYRVDAILGVGGMGRVYRVRDGLYPDRPTALKTVLPSVDEQVASLFRTEFQTMASLGHPGIARVYDFERMASANEFFFTMELLEGRPITAVSDPRDWRRIALMLAQVAQALDYIHRHGIIHLDVKPSNVLVSRDPLGQDRVKVLDFGLAGMKQSQGIFGTLSYLAPELIHGKVPDRRADIYSLGVMAFELLCGRHPYDPTAPPGKLLEAKSTREVKFPESAAAIPQWFRDVVLGMCAIDRDARPKDALEVQRQLGQGLRAASTPDAPSAPAVATSRFVGRERELSVIVDHVRSGIDSPHQAAGAPLLLVSGGDGVGKSRLVQEARHRLQVAGVAFLSGDCFAEDLAEYTPIVPVMLASARFAEASQATDLIEQYGPEIAKLAPGFGAAQGVIASPPLENAHAERRRILRDTVDFLLALSTRAGFAVCFNDLQWAPRGSVDLLHTLLERAAASPGARLAVVGTARTGGALAAPFQGFLETGASRGLIRTLSVDPLGEADARGIIQSLMGDEGDPDLVERLLAISGGEPFRIEQAVRHLVTSGGGIRPSKIEESGPAGEAALLGLSRLDSLDRHLIELLTACGRPVSTEILSRAADMSGETVHLRLRALEEQRLVILLPGQDSRYGLAHDRIREAVSKTLSASARESLHRTLGEAFTMTLPADDAGEHLLSTAAHLMAGGAPASEDAGLAHAVIAVRAARTALSATAYSQARKYLTAAASWLPGNKWERCLDLALELEEQRAYVGLAEERLDEAKESALRIEQQAKDPLQSARGRRIWIICELRKGNLKTVIEEGIELVGRLGERLPQKTNLFHTLRAISRVRSRFPDDAIARIESLPRMRDPRALEVDKLLEAVYLGVYLTEPATLPVILDLGTKLMMDHGLSPNASITLQSAGGVMAAMGDLPRCLALGDMAVRLLPRTHRSSHGMARYTAAAAQGHLRQPYREVSSELLAIRDECVELGDTTFAGLAAISWLATRLSAGAPLAASEAFVADKTTHELLESSALTRRMLRNIRQTVHHLSAGVGGRFFNGPFAIREDFVDRQGKCERAHYGLMVEVTYRLPASPSSRSLKVPLTIEKIWASTSFVPETYFHWAMGLLNASPELPPWSRWLLPLKVGMMRKRLGNLVALYPVNHKHRATLLEAEWLRYRRCLPEAIPLFEQAAHEADVAEDLRLGGLARELCAEAHLALGNREAARTLVDAARTRYEKWGSAAKIQDLDRRFKDLD